MSLLEAGPLDRPIPAEASWPPKLDLFGCGYSRTTYAEAVEAITVAALHGKSGVVSCHAAHAVVMSTTSASLREKVNQFDMVTPDGQPVRWAMNILHAACLPDRVYGPELMIRVCERAAIEGLPIYLYGGSPTVIRQLAQNLTRRFSNLVIAGYESPPFRELTREEDEQMVDRINSSGARIVFVGLGCPKQDLFGFHHRGRITGVQVCVGAAFDFHAGAKNMAPVWMGRSGLEWLFRLCQEPRRLWLRYLITNTVFIAKFARALCNVPGVLRQRRNASVSSI